MKTPGLSAGFIASHIRACKTIGRLQVVRQRDLRKEAFLKHNPLRQQILINWPTGAKGFQGECLKMLQESLLGRG